MVAKWSDNEPVDGWDHEGWDERTQSFQSVRDKPETSYLIDAINVLEDCADLMRKKGKDYQGGSVADADYYPHGWQSFDTMLSTKLLRFRSVMEQKGEVNYDSAEDCLRDLINYSARAVVWLERNQNETLRDGK